MLDRVVRFGLVGTKATHRAQPEAQSLVTLVGTMCMIIVVVIVVASVGVVRESF
jgi:hypothetical protein